MIIRGISTRADGNMSVQTGGIFFEAGEKNRAAFFEKEGAQEVVIGWLEHGTNIREVNRGDAGVIQRDQDGFITRERNLFLAITSADCLPMYYWNEEAGVVGIAHGGWRGLVSGIVPSLGQTIENMGYTSGQFHVEVGPGIQACHFEVQQDILPRFAGYPDRVQYRQGKTYIDLYGLVADQLVRLGIPRENISLSSECTSCLSEKYFSHRRDHFRTIETMVAYIARI